MSEALQRAETWLAWQRDLADPPRHSRDSRGDIVRIEEADGAWAEFIYDAQRRLSSTRRSSGEHVAYRYSEDDRLIERGLERFEYDDLGRLIRMTRGNTGGVVFRYNAAGAVTDSRTSAVSLDHHYDSEGRFTCIGQTIGGFPIQLRFTYDTAGRLSAIEYPGGGILHYRWTERGWPAEVLFNDTPVASWSYETERRLSRVVFANGIEETAIADPTDARPVSKHWSTGAGIHYTYNDRGQVISDSEQTYTYDESGRLASFTARDSSPVSLSYDNAGNIVNDAAAHRNAAGQLEWKLADGLYAYRYDDAGQLKEVLRDGVPIAVFLYDGKGRLAQCAAGSHVERYLYGPADELLAVTDSAGNLRRIFVRTPGAVLAEITPEEILYLHQDARGTTRYVSNSGGTVANALCYTPFGLARSGDSAFACYHGRHWFAEVGLYYFGARWYDPELCQFLTPDSYTASPDDIRIVNPLQPGAAQAALRSMLVESWLKRPQLRNRVAFCGNDPVNNSDPNGHWSFFGVLLSILLAIWTLPNTLFGLLIEITCLIAEVFRWLLSLISGGSINWESVGFDAASSGRLNAFALVFEGGWLGSFSSLLGITFGNVFFVYKQWRTHPHITATPTVSPAAYGGTVTFPRIEALYEHELRHTNQYGWFGPFFHLGLPIFGIYEWDIIFNGYSNSFLEADAGNYGGI